MATLGYANRIKTNCQRITTDRFRDWLEKTTNSTIYREFKRKYIAFEIQLNNKNSTEKGMIIREQTEELVEKWKMNA